MPYEKHIWETGEVITAEKLNHIEDGIAAATFYGPYSLYPSPESVDSTVSPGETIQIALNMVYDFTTGQESSYPSDLLHEQFITIITGYDIAWGMMLNCFYEPSNSESGYPVVHLTNVGNVDVPIGGVTNMPSISVYSSVRLASASVEPEPA